MKYIKHNFSYTCVGYKFVYIVQDSQDLPTPTPRQTGSMVMQHDDVVTRMKNVEMIELGLHKISPWYFSPYPQVKN